jgi:hypothetical protein
MRRSSHKNHEETPVSYDAGVLSYLNGTTLEELTGKPDRRRILAQNDGLCIYCNRRKADTVDHIFPRDCRKAFVWQPFNLAACCGPCNLQKGKQHWRTFYQAHPNYDPEREFWIEDRLRNGLKAFEAQQREECHWMMPDEYYGLVV